MPSRAFWSFTWYRKVNKKVRRLPDACRLILPDGRRSGFKRLSLRDLIVLWRLALKNPRVPIFYQINEIIRQSVKTALLTAKLRVFLKNAENISLICYSYWMTEAATGLSLLKLEGKIDCIITRCHRGDLYYHLLEHPYRPFNAVLAKAADGIVPISIDGEKYLVSKGFPKEKIALHRLGVKNPKGSAAKSTDGILRIVSCSNIIPVKRITLLAEALSKLKIPFKWVHFGDGDEKLSVERIISKFHSHGCAELRGRVPNSDVLSFYQSYPVDAFVNVSLSEGVPVSVMEALSYGIPCIVTDVGGTAEIVDDDVGMVLDPGITPEELTKIISSVATDRVVWAVKRINAINRASEMCCAEINYTVFADYLYNLKYQSK